MTTLPAPGDRCLSVRQPWASRILTGEKRIENRAMPTRYRGRIFIHSSARPERGYSTAGLPLGAILGCADLVVCVRLFELPYALRRDPEATGPYCWLLANPQLLPEPIPCKGWLGLWKWR